MKILINQVYRKKADGGLMKTIKYLLTAILMVSTGLSAMELVQNLEEVNHIKFEKINQRIKEDTAPIRASIGLASGIASLLSLCGIYSVLRYGLPDSNKMKYIMICDVLPSVLFGLNVAAFPLYRYIGLNKKGGLEREDGLRKKVFKPKLVENHKSLYLKHAFDTNTDEFKATFNLPFAYAGMFCAVVGVDRLVRAK